MSVVRDRASRSPGARPMIEGAVAVRQSHPAEVAASGNLDPVRQAVAVDVGKVVLVVVYCPSRCGRTRPMRERTVAVRQAYPADVAAAGDLDPVRFAVPVDVYEVVGIVVERTCRGGRARSVAERAVAIRTSQPV